MLFLGFAVFQDFKSFCLGMKSRNEMKTKNSAYRPPRKKKIETLQLPLPYCVHGMWQNFCYRNDSCNNKIWNLGTLENKGIAFLKKNFFFKEYHSCNKWWIRWLIIQDLWFVNHNAKSNTTLQNYKISHVYIKYKL